MGGLGGACLYAASNQSLIIGAILGGVGAVIGAFVGYEIRKKIVAAFKIKDLFHRFGGRLGHDRAGLLLCFTLTSRFAVSDCDIRSWTPARDLSEMGVRCLL
jgi:uncharacterized membrane protein